MTKLTADGYKSEYIFLSEEHLESSRLNFFWRVTAKSGWSVSRSKEAKTEVKTEVERSGEDVIY